MICIDVDSNNMLLSNALEQVAGCQNMLCSSKAGEGPVLIVACWGIEATPLLAHNELFVLENKTK